LDPQQILIIVLAAFAVAGTAFVLVPADSGRASKRQKVIGGKSRAAQRLEVQIARDAAARRSQVAESLKELEHRNRNKAASLSLRLERSGLDWTPRRFYLLSVISGFICAIAVYLMTLLPLAALFAGLAGLFGLPRWILGWIIKRRQARFVKEFPNAIDIIVRGVKSGLPLNDCTRIVASEAQEPVKSEFRKVLETQAVGVPIGEAVDGMYERLGVPEVNFFAIVIAIQAKAGGNLSEALGNLARVLRDRAKMKGKIQAMSMEAKASGFIIGSLPVIVAGGVYVMSPDYLRPLWETTIGNVLLGAAGFWMLCGVLTMRRMINFDF
jgi:tight adherence protein B